MILIVGPMFGFAAAFVTLYKGELGAVGSDECGAFEAGVLGAWEALFEILLGSDNQLGCLYDSTHSASGPLLMVLFLVLVVLLGLNMLIAIMAKTFDGMYENMVGNFMQLTTLLVINWEQAPIVPPPLRLLAVPYHTQRLLRALIAKCPDASRYTQLRNEAEDATVAPAPTSNDNSTGRKSRSLLLSSPVFRSSSDAVKDVIKVPPSAQLRGAVEKYLADHATDADAEDERWRARLARDVKEGNKKVEAKVEAKMEHVKDEMNAKVDAVNVKVDAVNVKVDAVNVKVEEMNATLRQILEMLTTFKPVELEASEVVVAER